MPSKDTTPTLTKAIKRQEKYMATAERLKISNPARSISLSPEEYTQIAAEVATLKERCEGECVWTKGRSVVSPSKEVWQTQCSKNDYPIGDDCLWATPYYGYCPACGKKIKEATDE